MSDTKAIHARIEGRVQGVSFRAWTQIEAKTRGLTGWVRNEDDGAVTTVMAGPVASVDEMLRELNHGPPAAVVRSVEVSEADWQGGNGFEILR
ncbi:MAG: acylphosphatase [Roseovarius indicus]